MFLNGGHDLQNKLTNKKKRREVILPITFHSVKAANN